MTAARLPACPAHSAWADVLEASYERGTHGRDARDARTVCSRCPDCAEAVAALDELLADLDAVKAVDAAASIARGVCPVCGGRVWRPVLDENGAWTGWDWQDHCLQNPDEGHAVLAVMTG